MSDGLIDLLSNRTEIYDLGRPLFTGIPQSPDHPQFRMSLGRRHGDLMRADGSSGSNEIIFTGGHVGTHIDALSHISFDGKLHGGIAVADAMKNGIYIEHGAERIGPWLCRGVLLDIPAALDRDRLDSAEEILPEHLDLAVERGGVRIEEGDVILIRSGWGRLFGDRQAFEGNDTGTPGAGPAAAHWLADRKPRAVGGDTIAFERLMPPARALGLPVHRTLIVDGGIHIIETLDLERLAADRITEFAFVLSPVPTVGATGAPVRPLALVERV